MKNKPYPYYYSENYETIKDLLDKSVQKYSNNVVFAFKRGKKLNQKTFSKFSDEVYALAEYFKNTGLSRKRIAILGENSYGWIVTWFAVVLSGNIAVPMDRMLNEEQLLFVLNDTEASMLAYSSQYAEFAVSLKGLGNNAVIISIDDEIVPYFEDEANRAVQKQADNTVDFAEKYEIALIIYTSGTTGVAKGVTLTNENLCANAVSVAMTYESAGNNILVLPLNHVYALQCLILGINKGRTTYISSGLKRFAAEMKEFSPDEMFFVPLFVEGLYDKIMNAAKEKGKEKALSLMSKVSLGLYSMGIDIRRKLFKSVLDELGGNLKMVLCGGAPLDPKYIKAFRAFGITLLTGYGITECSPLITASRKYHYKDGSAGTAINGVEIKTDAPDGRGEGEFYVRGKNVTHGYFCNEAATQEAFDGDWFMTGDIGYIDEDGFVFITGRKKNIIILSNGKNLYPEELEQQLMRVPAISEIVVYEDDRCVAAEIFPNLDWFEENKITDIKAHIDKEIDEFNKKQPAGKSISKLKLREECFEKTSTKKIIRKR